MSEWLCSWAHHRKNSDSRLFGSGLFKNFCSHLVNYSSSQVTSTSQGRSKASRPAPKDIKLNPVMERSAREPALTSVLILFSCPFGTFCLGSNQATPSGLVDQVIWNLELKDSKYIIFSRKWRRAIGISNFLSLGKVDNGLKKVGNGNKCSKNINFQMPIYSSKCSSSS